MALTTPLSPITLKLPNDGSISFYDVFDIFELIFIDGVPSVLNDSMIEGVGFFNGVLSTYAGTGTGFSLGLIQSFPYVVTGTLDQVVFTTGTSTLRFLDMQIDQSTFAPLLHSDKIAASPFALENYLMDRDWNLKLSQQSDTIAEGALVGDGAVLNLRGDDVINARGGDDMVFTGDGDDLVFAGAGNDVIDGGIGNDSLRGGTGADTIYGRAGQDRLVGDRGTDSLFGGGNNDVLDGGLGRDILNGGTGSDRFVFRDDYNIDTITDFDAFDNAELIDLRNVTQITDYADLLANHMVQDGANVVIDDTAGTTIIVENVLLADLDILDFVF